MKTYMMTLKRMMMTVLMMLITVSAMRAEQKIWLHISGNGKAQVSLGETVLTFDKDNMTTVKEDAPGKTVTVSVKPDNGYKVASVTAQLTTDAGNADTRGADDAGFLEVKKASDTEYTFEMPKDFNVRIYVTISKKESGSKFSPFTLTTAADVTNGTETLYWIESKGATGFFAMSHTDNTRLTTSNMPNERMLWYFMDANTEDDTENGRQYYYVVNEFTGKYMKLAGSLGSANSIQIATFSSSDTEANKDKFRFIISENPENSGAWVLFPKNATNNGYWVNKDKSNVGYNTNATTGWFKASNYNSTIDDNSRWYFRERNNVTWAHPFTNSTEDVKHYYLIHNKHKTYTSYYMSTHNDYVSVSTEENDNRVWYFKEAASDATIPNMKYYYIVNATTGNYMYFNSNKVDGSSLTSDKNAVDIRAYSSGDDEERYQFAIMNAKGDAYSAYSIIPKNLIGLYDHCNISNNYRYTALGASTMSNNSHIGTLDDRGSNDNTAHWTIEETTFAGAWADPEITCGLDGKITITNGEEDDGATYYYTTDGSTTPTTESTQYDATSKPTVSTGKTIIKVRAIATGKSPSNVVTKTIVYNPTVTYTAETYTYTGSAQDPVSSVDYVDTDNSTNNIHFDVTTQYTVSYKKGDAAVTECINADTYTIVINDVEGDDYIVCGTKPFIINQKSVIITADNADKTYNGTALTKNTFSASALETGDTHTFTVTMTPESTITNAGTQPNVIATVDGIAVTTGTATDVGNYKVTTVDGTLTINPKAVTITANDATKGYDRSALTETGFTASALEDGDTHTFTIVMTGESTITNAGTQPNVIATVDGVAVSTGTETAVGNYLVTTANGTLTINPKDLSSADITIGITKNGNAYTVTVKDGETELKTTDHYSLSVDETNPKYYVATATGKYDNTLNPPGNYTGTITAKYVNVAFSKKNPGDNTEKWSATFVIDSGEGKFSTPTGFTPHIVTAVNDGNVTLSAIDYIPEEVPVLLLSDSEAAGFVAQTAGDDDIDTSANKLLKANKSYPTEEPVGQYFGTGTIYLLYKGEFVLNMAGALTAGKVYLPKSSGAGTRLAIFESRTTDIKGATLKDKEEMMNDKWYSLDGRRLNGKPTKKGVYIINGKKSVVK